MYKGQIWTFGKELNLIDIDNGDRWKIVDSTYDEGT